MEPIHNLAALSLAQANHMNGRECLFRVEPDSATVVQVNDLMRYTACLTR
jgi:hypothetical protein